MEDPTVSSDDAGVEEGTSHSNKSLAKPGGPPSSSSRRRRTYLTAAAVGLVLIVGIVVVLSLSLTGAFDESPSPATSASPPKSESSSSSNSTTNLNSSSGSNNASNVVVGDDSNETFPNTTSSAPISNTTSTQPDGEDSEPSNGNTTSGSATNNGDSGEGEGGEGSTTEKEPLTAPGGARYPTDPNEYWDVVWVDDGEFITALTFDNGETVFIRWPECVGMEGPECETLIRSTNPYVTEVFLMGPDDFTDASFQNDRVNVWLDADGVLVRDVPYIG
jgi:Potato inhibitor I family